jgi:hypothetical protein
VSWKMLGAVRRGMTSRAGVARHKGRGHAGAAVEQRRRKNRTKDKVARRNSIDGRSGGENGRARKATMGERTET